MVDLKQNHSLSLFSKRNTVLTSSRVTCERIFCEYPFPIFLYKALHTVNPSLFRLTFEDITSP